MLGNIIGGIAGGLITNKGQRDANRTNQQNHMREIANRDLHAKNRIQWMAKDAQAAGISPLAALGGGLPAFSPVAQPQQQNALRSMGQAVQNAGRAIQSPEARQQQANLLQNQHLQNKLLATQIAGQQIDNGIRSNQMTQTNDPIPGQPDSASGVILSQNPAGTITGSNTYTGPPVVQSKLAEVEANIPGSPLSTAGTHAEVSFARGPNGTQMPIPSEKMTQVIESDVVAQVVWNITNRVAPDPQRAPSKHLLPPGYDNWVFRTHMQRWVPIKGPVPYSAESFKEREKATNDYLSKLPTWMATKVRSALKNSPGKNMRHTR